MRTFTLLPLLCSGLHLPSRPPSAAPSVAEPSASRRQLLLGLGAAVVSAGSQPASAAPALSGYDPAGAVTRPEAGRLYFPTLTPPLFYRATYRYDLGRDCWALEQLLTFANVSATIRSTVIKLQDGTLWVNSPQWPTGELCALLDELGPVGHIVLPCNALEHAAPMKAFVKKYPKASVWVTPGQYGPFGTCGLTAASAQLGYRVDGVLPVGKPQSGDPLPPWADEFEMRTLYVSLPENAGPVSEAAFYHRPSKSLVAVDAVVFVPDAPPPIFRTYFDDATVAATDFWPKTVLQALRPPPSPLPPPPFSRLQPTQKPRACHASAMRVPCTSPARAVLQAVFLPLRRRDGAGDAGRWPGYAAVQGKLLRAPILRAFADARAPAAVRAWVREVATMGPFERILTAHFASPIAATPADFERTFSYLDGPTADPPIACEDWKLLDGLNSAIETNKLGAPVVYDFKAGCPPAER